MVTLSSIYSCLENSMDRGAWWATDHWVAELDATEHAKMIRWTFSSYVVLSIQSIQLHSHLIQTWASDPIRATDVQSWMLLLQLSRKGYIFFSCYKKSYETESLKYWRPTRMRTCQRSKPALKVALRDRERMRECEFIFQYSGWKCINLPLFWGLEKVHVLRRLLLYAIVFVIWHLQDSVQMYAIKLHFLRSCFFAFFW